MTTAHPCKRILVVNKIDLLGPLQRESLRDQPGMVHVSAAKGIGLTTLLDAIDDRLHEDPLSRVRLHVPQSDGKALALLEARARILSRQYRDGMVELEASAPESLLRHMRGFVVK